MHSNTSRILELFCHEFKKLIAHFIPMVSLKLLVENFYDCCRFLHTSLSISGSNITFRLPHNTLSYSSSGLDDPCLALTNFQSISKSSLSMFRSILIIDEYLLELLSALMN
ncbi:hypothetical protein Tco_0333983 [Tanacetum coccineum]